MEGYLVTLLMRPLPGQPDPNVMSLKLFPARADAVAWIEERDVPPWAFGWWLEEFNADGDLTCSRSQKSGA